MSILSVDIGGTYIKYAVMEPDASILQKGKLPTPMTNREDLLNSIETLFRSIPTAAGIAVSLPGIIDPARGHVLMGGALRYNDDFDFGPSLSEKCGVPVHLENDARCAAMAEAASGALKDVTDGFVLILGTMIGGAFIKDHRLHRGFHFSAGEVSYIILNMADRFSADDLWGNRCSANGLCRSYADRKGIAMQNIDGITVFTALEQGDRDALYALEKYAHEIAVQIFNLQTILDPQRFAIGGGISARPELTEAICRQLDRLYDSCPYQIPRAQVVACKFKNDANLIGALQCYLKECGCKSPLTSTR